MRDEWKFDGVVVSDWGGVNDTRQSIYNGLDMEFGTWTDGLSEGISNAYDNYYLANPFLELLRSGEVKEEEVDKKVRNILRLVFRTTMDTKRPWGSFGTEEHALAARKIAQEGIVLLQNNNNVLPIDVNNTKKIAVIGENAIKMMTVGGGSSSLKARYEVSPLDGLRNNVPAGVEVVYARGYVGDTDGSYNGVSSGQDLTEPRTADVLIREACDLAREADVVVFVGGLNKSYMQDCEGNDRQSLGLPYAQDELIRELSKTNKNLVVVLITGNAVAMPWVKEVPAILQAWYLGTEAGNAIATVLTGEVNPSGKLPFTFPVKLEDNGAHALGEYPGTPDEVTYHESIFVGCRWTDKNNIKPLFPFGHGLSYTTFKYGKVAIDKKNMTSGETVTVTVPVKNTGNRAGAEVVQLYISDLKSSLPRPVKELKGFEKVELAPGEEKLVSFRITEEALQFFDDKKHSWIAEPGDFEVFIGASATNIKGKTKFKLNP